MTLWRCPRCGVAGALQNIGTNTNAMLKALGLKSIERRGYWQWQGGRRWRPCDLHVWLGPIGVHIFRDPFKVELDLDWPGDQGDR